MRREPNIVSILHIDMKKSSLTMLWLDFRSRQAVNRCRYAYFWGSEHPFGSDTNPLYVLSLLKMKQEPNIVYTLYIDMMECSLTMLWLDFTSWHSVNQCWYACFGGSEHPFGSDISSFCLLPLLKTKWEANKVSTLYIDMTERSSTMPWLYFKLRQALPIGVDMLVLGARGSKAWLEVLSIKN